MSRSNKAMRAALLSCALLLFLVPGVRATELPDDLIQLMPQNPDLIVVMPSADELGRAWEELKLVVADFDAEESAEMPAFKNLLGDMEPMLVDALDWSKPIAMTIKLGNVMAGEQPLFSIVLPLADSDWDVQGLAEALGTPSLKRMDNYLLLSQDPAYVAATSPSPLLDRLPPGVISVSANMQTMWNQMSPLLDFGLMAATAPKPPAEGEDGAAEPQMSTEEVAALGDMVRTIMNSADMIAFGMDLQDRQLSFIETFVSIPGSVLDPPAQPDMKTALELTKLVDTDADWVGAYALDVNEALQVYRDFYLISLQDDLSSLKTDLNIDLAAVMDDYFKILRQFMVPGAFAMNLGAESIDLAYVLATSEGQAIIQQQMESQTKYGEAFPFLVSRLTEGEEIEGHQVTGWDFDWNADQLKALMENELEGNQPDEDAEMVMAAVTGLYQKIMPGIRMLATDDHFFMVMGRESDPLAEMVRKAAKNKGKKARDLEKLAKQAGPHCQAAFHGDLASVMVMVFEMVEEFSQEDMPALDLDPMPLSYTVLVDDLAYTVDYHFSLKGLPKLVKAFEDFEDH